MTELGRGPWHRPGKWFVSPHFWEEAVQAQMPHRPNRVSFRDVTLREGEETVGVVFTMEDRVEIARRLQDLGVPEFEMPMFAGSSVQEQKALLRALVDAGVTMNRCYLVSLTSAWQKDVDRAIDCGADRVQLISQLPDGLGAPARGPVRSPGEVLEDVLAAIAYCKVRNVSVTVSTPGATRLPLQMLLDFHSKAASSGADRVSVSDSMGIGMPAAVRFLVRRVKEAVGSTPVLIHCHNDLGLATANTLAGVEGGAEWVDVVVNGLGDRAGNGSLEEVVTALELYGVDTGIHLDKLTELSRFMEDKTGVNLQPNKAVVGANAFLEESAPHFLMTKKAEKAGVPEAAVPYVPELVGQRHVLIIGSSTLHGGAIEYKLDEWGYRCAPEQVEEVRQVAEKKIAVQRYLSEEEFRSVCRQVLGSPQG